MAQVWLSRKGNNILDTQLKVLHLNIFQIKTFLINNIQSKKLGEINNKYLFFEIKENNNNINVYFSKKSYELVGWQIEDIYQNLAVTYIFDTAINKNIDEKLFKLPKKD